MSVACRTRECESLVSPVRRHRAGRFARRVQHLWEAVRHRRLILDWAPIAFGFAGLKDLSAGSTIRLRSGLRFAIGHSSDAWTLIQIMGRNDYRIRDTERWRTVIDIGANIGTFAVLAARAAPEARVYCYEPSADTCRLLRTNLALNGVEGRVSVNQYAVAGAAGAVQLESPPQSSMRRVRRTGGGTDANTVVVEAVTLATVFEQHAIARCDFLKVDCEGAEYEILRACPGIVLDRVDRIALEFHEWEPGQDHRELAALLAAQGFRVEHAYDPLDRETGYLFADRDE